MAIKVLIKRKIPEGLNDPLFNDLIRKLRALASVQPGYISGVTFKRVDQPREFLVVSTWQNIDAWNEWRTNRERNQLQEQINAIIGAQTEYEVYEYL